MENSNTISGPAVISPVIAATSSEATKPYWASQTVWSSLAVIGSSAAGAALAWKSGDLAAFGAALTAMLGGINAIAGRFRATKIIG